MQRVPALDERRAERAEGPRAGRRALLPLGRRARRHARTGAPAAGGGLDARPLPAPRARPLRWRRFSERGGPRRAA